MIELELKNTINIKKINVGDFFGATDEKFKFAQVVVVNTLDVASVILQSCVCAETKDFRLSHLKPFDLNLSWLLAFGFDEIDEESCFKTLCDGRTLEVYFNGFDWLFELNGTHLEKTVITSVPYVHILQSLYLEFTDTELMLQTEYEHIETLPFITRNKVR